MNVVLSQSMSAECQAHHFHKKMYPYLIVHSLVSLDIVGFLLFLPVRAQLVDFAGHISLFLHIICLEKHSHEATPTDHTHLEDLGKASLAYQLQEKVARRESGV